MILDFAREESAILRQKGIGGSVFVALHGHVRTTVDVDVFVPEPREQFAEALKAAGFAFDCGRTVFIKSGAAVHLVLVDQVRRPPADRIKLAGETTVHLGDVVEVDSAPSGSHGPCLSLGR